MNGQTNGVAEASDSTTPFPSIEDEPVPENLKAKKRSDTVGTHKRSISGNLLSKLSLLRPTSDQDKSDGVDSKLPRGAMADVQNQQRKRKGSLRKTVLGKGRDRKGSEKKSPLSSPVTTPTAEDVTPRPSRDFTPMYPESPPRWPFRTLSRVSLPSIRSSIASAGPASSAASITSPTIDGSTDEDDLVLPQMPGFGLRKTPSGTSTNDSYFPPVQEPVRRMFSSRTRSPLATQPQSVAGSPIEDSEWDYSETAFWGYVILAVTWIVFVVGVGSCFGVWSWAWDVGETPKTTPELEDDPTLPIVGYYPALLVLTCIMAWVWVVVAWVGMKYFRHADFKGEEG